MKRTTRRLLSLLMAVVLCLGLTPVTAWAIDLSGDGWEIKPDENNVYTLYIENDTGMNNWVQKNSGGSYSIAVQAVDLANTVTTIPDNAFYKCAYLTTIEVPASVTTIGSSSVFIGCTGLTSITVDGNNERFTAEDGILYNKNKTEVLICPQGMSGEVKLPDSVTEIGSSAFAGCIKLTGVNMPSTVTTIGDAAFEGCSSLISMELPASLSSLGSGVFEGCSSLASLTLAEENTKYSVQDDVLYDGDKANLLLYPAAKADTNFTIPTTVTSIEDNAFGKNSHLQTVVATNLDSIGSGAFLDCTALTSFSAQSLGTVESQAFSGCSELATFSLANGASLATIGEEAFLDCKVLTAVPLSGATSIGAKAFQNCTALTALEFCKSGSVTIGESAFSGCTGLTALEIPANVTSIGDSAFSGCTNVDEVVFSGVTPPECGTDIIPVGNLNEFQIIVPDGSEDAYKEELDGTLENYVSSARKYPLFVNGQQFTSKNLNIDCGSGTVAFDAETSTLTLDNATIDTMGGHYGYGGAINSGLPELTITLVGENTIKAEGKDQWDYPYWDSINSDRNCNIVIESGEASSMPSLTCDVIDLGRGDTLFDGSEDAGNLTVDGVELVVTKYARVQHDVTFQNGAQVNVAGGLTANHSATITVMGEATDVTVESISMGNEEGPTPEIPNSNHLELQSGTLTITGSVSYSYLEDTDSYAIRSNRANSGSISINGGTLQTSADCKATNIPTGQIAVDNSLQMTGSWEGGPVLITAKPDGKVAVTVAANPEGAGTVTGDGRYEPDTKATVTAEAEDGWFFIGWYQDSGETAVSTSKSYEFTVETADVTLTARFIEDKLYQAEQAKTAFEGAQANDSLTWAILTDAVDAYNEVLNFLKEVKGIEELLTEDEETALQNRYTNLTTYYNSVQALNLSNQGIGSADLAKLAIFIGVTDLNLSGNKGVTGLADLSQHMRRLATLDISGTGVTTADVLMSGNALAFASLTTLTANNLTLNSISALAQLVDADDFNAGSVTKWDFTGSTLPDTEGSKADVKAIQDELGGKFIPPTLWSPTPGGVGGAVTYGVVVADCAHGKVTAEPAKAAKGDTVTVTVTPDEGYELESLAVSDAGGKAVEVSRNDDGTFSFVMPAGNVTVSAVLGCDGGALCPSAGLTDVDQSQWYHDAVDWAVSTGVMTGFGNGLFGPDVDLTRAQMAQILWNVEGRPAVDYPIAFGDVSGEDWFHGAVAWAASEGIFEGYGAGSGLFGPEDALTREQAAAVLMRWAAFRGEDTSARADLSAYPDAGDVSEWAVECVSWAVAQGVIAGVGLPDGTLELDPLGTTSRAQTATLMMRLVG